MPILILFVLYFYNDTFWKLLGFLCVKDRTGTDLVECFLVLEQAQTW